MINPPPSPLGDETYEDVANAVMETPRGRWFLAEYARRLRSEETARILDAIARIERRLASSSGNVAEHVDPIAPAAYASPVPPVPARTPIDALMARLTAALEETSRAASSPRPLASIPGENLEALDRLSTDERLRLFY